MRIAGILFTHHLPAESMPWIAEARSVFDEMVIFIDEKRVTPGTMARAEKVGSRVLSYKADTWFGADAASLVASCESDWLFVLDYDEQLSPAWQQKEWRQILETTRFTHFWFPRRWIVPGGRYITGDPWWPDLQLRLFRNNPEIFSFPEKLHDSLRVSGPSAYFQNLAIHHHVLWLLPRKSRVEKVRFYERLRPGGGLSHLYLYEDFRPPEARLPKPGKLELGAEVRWMDKLQPEDISKVSCRIAGVPPLVRPGELFWVDADVANATSQPLYPYPPYPVRLAYHWLKKATRRVVIFEGHRSGLFPSVPANETVHSRMAIVAPVRPGEYILQTSIVQDNAYWFDQLRPDIGREFFVSVTGSAPPSRRKSLKSVAGS